jgi:hypothetical protein
MDSKGEAMKRFEKGTDDLVEKALDALKPGSGAEGIVSPLDELSERRMTQAILERFQPERRTLGTLRRPSWKIAAALVVLVGCGGALYGFLRPEQLPPPEVFLTPASEISKPLPKGEPFPESRNHIPGSRFALLFGEVFSEHSPVTMGAEIPTAERIRTGDGQAVLSLPTGIAAGLAENTALRVLWKGDHHYGVSMQSGMALFSVDPRQPREGFFIDTPAGTVRVKGTLFTVVVSPENEVFIKLHRGQLEVESPGGAIESLTSGNLVNLNGQRPAKPAVNEKVLSQLQALRCMDRGELFTELSHFECLGTGESAPVQSLRHRPPPGTNRSHTPSIKDLMEQARHRKAEGNWWGAAASYEEVIRRYPNCDEARTSMVSLAQIRLKHQDNPRGAIRQFSNYLKRPGPLSREAMFGRAEAFRALGDRAGEERALGEFLDTFPNGFYAKAVSKRLKQLRAEAAVR